MCLEISAENRFQLKDLALITDSVIAPVPSLGAPERDEGERSPDSEGIFYQGSSNLSYSLKLAAQFIIQFPKD